MCGCFNGCTTRCGCSCHEGRTHAVITATVKDAYAEACDEVFRLKRELMAAEEKAERLSRARRGGLR